MSLVKSVINNTNNISLYDTYISDLFNFLLKGKENIITKEDLFT
jgi:hypothetical protein